MFHGVLPTTPQSEKYRDLIIRNRTLDLSKRLLRRCQRTLGIDHSKCGGTPSDLEHLCFTFDSRSVIASRLRTTLTLQIVDISVESRLSIAERRQDRAVKVRQSEFGRGMGGGDASTRSTLIGLPCENRTQLPEVRRRGKSIGRCTYRTRSDPDADIRIKRSRRDTYLRGCSCELPLGLPDVRAALEECRSIADRQRLSEPRGRCAALQVPVELRGGPAC